MLLVFVTSMYGQFTTSGLPQAHISPDTIQAVLTQCNDSVSFPITVSNTGSGPLLYNVSFGEGFTDNFESGTENHWILEGEWGLSSNAFEGNYALASSPNGYYGDDWAYAAYLSEPMKVFNAESASISFSVIYDLYCCGSKSASYSYCDNIYAQISVNGGEFQDIYSAPCYTDEWQLIELNLSTYVSNGDSFTFRFLFSTDDYGDGEGVFIDNFEIAGAGVQVNWISFGNMNGMIMPGDTVIIPVVFSSHGISTGIYTGTFPIQTSDTGLMAAQVYYRFELQGQAAIALSTPNIDFGVLPVNGSKTDTLLIENIGCDTLNLTSIQIIGQSFTSSFAPAKLAAFQTVMIPVTFHPDSIGPFSAEITINSNAGVVTANLQGSGTIAPQLVFYPPSIDTVIGACGDSVSIPFTVYNNGTAALNLSIAPEVKPMATQVCTPENYNYNCCGMGIYQVVLGDIFHTTGAAAGELNLDFSSQISTTLIAGQSYPLSITTGTENQENIRMWIDYNNNGSFEADEVAFEEYNNPSALHEGTIEIPDHGIKQFTKLRMRVVSEYSYYPLPGPCDPVYYGQFEDYAVIIKNATAIQLDTTIQAGDSLSVEFTAYSTGLLQGMHTFNIAYVSNDPVTPSGVFPVHVTLQGSPRIGLSANNVAFDSVFQHSIAMRTMEIYNSGCAPLIVPVPASPGPDLQVTFPGIQNDTAILLPGDTLILGIMLQSAIVGDFNLSLDLLNNDHDTTIQIQAYIMASAIPVFSPEPGLQTISGCNDSLYLPVTLYNNGSDTLIWAGAQNNPGEAISFSGYPDQEVLFDSIEEIPEKGTIEFWFTQEYLNYWQNMSLLSWSFSNFNTTGAGFDLRYNYDYLELLAGDSNGSYNYYTIATYIPAGSWNHVAISWDMESDSLWTYYNGNLVQRASQVYWSKLAGKINLGRGQSSSYVLNGKMDEVRIWKTTRSANQITHFHSRSVSPDSPGLMAYWDFNEDTGTEIIDKGPNGYHGMLTAANHVPSSIVFENSAVMTPLSGSIAPGDSVLLTGYIHAQGLTSGNHESSFSIQTNSFSVPFLSYPVQFNLIGSAGITISPAALSADSLMTGLPQTDTLLVSNPGCDTLFVTQIITHDTSFQSSVNNLVIPPFKQDTIYIVFQPNHTGFISDTMSLISNAGTVTVPLSVTGLPAPAFVVTPDTLFLTSTACGIPVSGSVSLSNAGGVQSSFSVLEPQKYFFEDFEEGMGRWTSSSNAWSISSGGYLSENALYFYHSYSSNLIHDIDLKEALQVSNPDSVQISAMIKHYLSCSYYGYDNFRIYVSVNGGPYKGVLFSSCNQLNYGLKSTNYLDGLEVNDIIRIRISVNRYGYYSSPTVNLDNFKVTGVHSNPGFTNQGISGILEPGNSINIPIVFNNTNISLGKQTTSITIQTGSPLQPQIIVPVVVDFQGTPHCDAGNDSLEFGHATAFSTKEIPLNIYNTGCDTLRLNAAICGTPVFVANYNQEFLLAGDSMIINVQFKPLIAGVHYDTLVLQTNAETLLVKLRGTGGFAPMLLHEPDTIIAEIVCEDDITYALHLKNSGDTLLEYLVDPAQNDGLMAYYPFHGNVVDHSGNGRHLTDEGTLPGRGIEDQENTARRFTGNQVLKYTNQADIGTNLYSPYASVSFWVNPDSSAYYNYQQLFQIGYNLDISISSGALKVYSQATNDEYFSLEVPAIYNQWTQVTVTFDGLNFKLFLNGELAASETADSCELTYYEYFKQIDIGNLNSSYSLTGQLDEIRLYNRGLSDEEVFALYESFKLHYISLNSSPFEGGISTSDSTTLSLNIDTKYLKSGVHAGKIYLRSSDPRKAFFGIPYQITVSGSAQAVLPATCFDFGPVMVNATKSDSILVKNEGCHPLQIDSLQTGLTIFVPESGPVSIAAFNSKWIKLIYAPVSSGSHMDTLSLFTNDGIHKQCLVGTSPGKPSLQANNNLFAKILACVSTGNEDLVITNNGNLPLVFSITPGSNSNWLQLPVTSATLAAGEQSTISMLFDRTGLNSGIYTTALTIISNDPNYPLVSVSVHMLVSNTYILANLGTDTAFCLGGTYTLNPGYFSYYLWSNGSTNSTISISEPGTYSVSVSDISGCISADTVSIEQLALPIVFAGTDTNACSNTPFQLQAQILNPLPWYPKTIKLGTGTNFTTDYNGNPLSSETLNRRTQYVYHAYELEQAGIRRGYLKSIAFNLSTATGAVLNDYTVSIGISPTNYQNGLYAFVNQLTEVYHANNYVAVTGWNTFELNTPIYWDGDQSIIIQVCHNNLVTGTPPAYEYSYNYRQVFSYQCNCGNLCGYYYGYYSHIRPNIQMVVDADINEYHWTGPDGLNSTIPDPVISQLHTWNSGTYTLTIDNGYGCTGSGSFEMNVIPSPVVSAGNDIQAVGWDTIQLTASASAAPEPFVYQWSPVNGLSSPDSSSTDVFINNSETYTMEVLAANGCISRDSVTLNITPRFPLSGHLSYDNAFQTPLRESSVIRKNASSVVTNNTTTNEAGNYLFNLIPVEKSFITANSALTTGGINATDALQVARHIAGLLSLGGVKLKSADVNGNKILSAADALLILHHTAGNISTFPAGNWTFEEKEVFQQSPGIVTNLLGLSTGDVNGSFNPGARTEPSVSLDSESFITSTDEILIPVPVKIVKGGTLGALSLSITWDPKIINVEEVSSVLPGVVTNLREGQVRLAWYDVEGHSLGDGAAFLTLWIKKKAGFDAHSEALFTLENECELADINASVRYQEVLQIPRIRSEVAGQGTIYVGQNQPNPFTGRTEIPILLPESGKVSIDVMTIHGSVVIPALETDYAEGSYYWPLDLSHLEAGMYLYRFRFYGKTVQHQETKMMILTR